MKPSPMASKCHADWRGWRPDCRNRTTASKVSQGRWKFAAEDPIPVGWSLFSLPPLSLEVFSCYEPSHVKFQTGSETRHFPHRPWWWWLSVSRPRHRKTMTSASEGRTCRSGSKGQRCHIRWCHDADARGGPSEPVTHEIRGARRLVIRSAQPPSEVARNGNLCEHGSANQACCWRRPDPSSGWLREEIST